MFEQFIEKLKNDSFLTLETTPKHSATFTPIIERIKELGLHKKVDGFSVTDSPLAKMRYSALFASLKLQNTFKKPTIATVSMRDRNKIGLQSDLLGANESDIRAILALTGDPASMSDQPKTKGVFEGNSTLLLDMINCFNGGIDYAGKPLDTRPAPIYPFAVANAFARNPKNLQKKLRLKLEHGAQGVITQPVYSIENAKMLLELFAKAKIEAGPKAKEAELILGFFPITKLRTAQFLTAHVPGVEVPKTWSEKLFNAKNISDVEQEKIGLEMSIQTFSDIYDLHPKMHMMAANNFALAKKIIENRR
ncbi:MAG: methylenetetrahydrofolate reductase [Epsilonproteobacteria bacterium]|nr:methylenetetrahydrofolate reductase [Campylobacterota bacterium]